MTIHLSSRQRTIFLFGLIALAIALVFANLGQAYGLRMLAEASCFAIIALGLTIQWGYAGLFNAGVMGFIAVGGFTTMLLSYPVNEAFWNSSGPAELGGLMLKLTLVAVVVVALSQIHRLGIRRQIRNVCVIIAVLIGFALYNDALIPVARYIETEAGFIGGFGLPVWIGWLVGGLAAGGVAYCIGRICLGLRADYLAIATLGIAEIIKAVFKNADWLTRGTLTVSPLPWPIPTPNELGFVTARALYLCVTAILIAVIFIALQRVYLAPWGRMMRAIRDNEISAAAMGKNVNRRRLEIFVVGSVIIGIGGAALITFARIFDPSGFTPLHHTFLVWVMVIIGGAGNNLGAIFGAVAVYIIWTMSEPLTLFVFQQIEVLGQALFAWETVPDFTSRALQMRVFIIGLTITLALRFLPKGLFPEQVKHFKSPSERD